MNHRLSICFWVLLASAPFAKADVSPIPTVRPGSTRPPNIVLIMADDMGFETLGCNGGVSYRTPHLDRLARQGVRFEQCYSQPLCTPSRVKLMTGQTNRRNYVRFGYLDVEQRTFAHDLKDAGYATCIVGKWQLNGTPELTEAPPLTRPALFGFDRWRLWQLADSGRVEKNVNGKQRRIDARYANPVLNSDGVQSDAIDGGYGPDLCVDYAIDFMQNHRDRPFLVYYPMILPHGPFYPTPHSEAWQNPRRRGHAGSPKDEFFGDMVAYTDHLVGRIVDELKRLDLAENTWVLFTGDNGTYRTVISKMADGRTVTGGKGLMKDRGTHVPMIAWRSGMDRPGRTSDALIDFSDFAPTLNEMASTGRAEDSRFDGRSFLGAITGDPSYQSKDAIHVWYEPNRVGSRRSKSQSFARDQRYKKYANGKFFDLTADPEETKPLDLTTLSGQASEAATRLTQTLQRYESIEPVLNPAAEAADRN